MSLARFRRPHTEELKFLRRSFVGGSRRRGFSKNSGSSATVVIRILDASGEIVGKAVCEDLCFWGSSHTSFPQAMMTQELIISGPLPLP
ncbi:MAG: hypothetical protein M3315_11490 [Actinomycetota bacterium]|nr:hypothetical protein [Actinomycetota bacterium]MDQ3911003.1 hypothetical protein [Actinomycetota bacterium]